jgi:hypothetical protein
MKPDVKIPPTEQEIAEMVGAENAAGQTNVISRLAFQRDRLVAELEAAKAGARNWRVHYESTLRDKHACQDASALCRAAAERLAAMIRDKDGGSGPEIMLPAHWPQEKRNAWWAEWARILSDVIAMAESLSGHGPRGCGELSAPAASHDTPGAGGEFHLDARCGSCGGPLQCDRDAICYACAPEATFWELAAACQEASDPLTAEERRNVETIRLHYDRGQEDFNRVWIEDLLAIIERLTKTIREGKRPNGERT